MASKDKSALLPAYLLVGENRLKRDAIFNRLRIRLEELGDLAFNNDEFHGGNSDASEMVIAATTMPFASEKRLVVVYEADKVSKKDVPIIAEYLNSPSLDTVLVLVADKLPKSSEIYKAVFDIDPKAVITCDVPKRSELPSQVVDMARAHGFDMERVAADKLIDLVGEDMIRLDAEVVKLCQSKTDASPIDSVLVEAMVAETREIKPWEFVDAFARKDLAACIRILNSMPTSSSHMLLRQAVGRLRELVCAKSMIDRGSDMTAVADALKLTKRTNKRLKSDMVWKAKQHVDASRRFSLPELRRAIASSMDTERRMKSGYDADAMFLEWLIEVLA